MLGYFPIEKITKDLFEYLQHKAEKINDESTFLIDSYEEMDGSVKCICINLQEFTIVTHKYNFNIFSKSHFIIIIGFGNVVLKGSGLCKIEKCAAYLTYDTNLNMYELEFSHTVNGIYSF